MYRDVLIGLDGSPAAARALAAAIALADREGGRLTIITAVPPVAGWPAGPAESLTAAREVTAQLERQACALQRRALETVPRCLPVTTIVAHGRPCAVLLARIAVGRHDVVVVGSDGARRRLRWRSSLAARLRRRAPVPVLVDGAPAPRRRLARRAGLKDAPARS